MPIRRNPAYGGDPYMAQAAQNIASLYAPEDPSKIAAGALAFQKAQAERAETERLADLYSYMKSPGYDPAMADRMGMGAGRWKPTESLYRVDTDAATTRRGQDVEAGTKQNVALIDQYGQLKRQYAAPIKLGEGETAFLPQQTQRNTGLAPMLGGQTRLKPGEVVIQPGGARLEGNPAPVTMDQVRAATFAGLPPELRQALMLGGEGITEVQTPGGPVVQSRAGAIGLPAVPAGDKITEVSRLIAERDRLPAGDPNRRAYDARIEALGRGQQQSAYDKEMDEGFAKENAKINAQANAARTQLGSLQFMRQLLANPETQQGFGGETALQFRKALEALGMPVGNTTDAEVARAISNKLALYARNEGGENLMPGALSDSDRPFLQQQVAGLGNTRGANMKLLDYYERVQRRAIEVEGLRQAYVQRNGRIDEGFRRELSAWAEANPVFPEARPEASANSGAVGIPASAPSGGARPQFRVLSVR
ncbi:hypothetical protein [Enterovirga sp. CN4-39]|uniref:hypothetical protein n=1 Tax=Enterovirga sp. CN4-39 TaxID=3400910 RepID=UPI003C04ABCF